MRKAMLAALAAVVMLTGCASGQLALMQNGKGELARCEVSVGDVQWSGTLSRDRTIEQCVQEYTKAGYRRL